MLVNWCLLQWWKKSFHRCSKHQQTAPVCVNGVQLFCPRNYSGLRKQPTIRGKNGCDDGDGDEDDDEDARTAVNVIIEARRGGGSGGRGGEESRLKKKEWEGF